MKKTDLIKGQRYGSDGLDFEFVCVDGNRVRFKGDNPDYITDENGFIHFTLETVLSKFELVPKSQKAIKSIIVLTLPNSKKETWGSLSEICDKKGFKINTLYKKEYPFTHEGILFEKLPFREESK